MSNRNSRAKHLEKVIKKTRKETRDMGLDILQLHEENSKLRLELEKICEDCPLNILI